MLRTLPGSVAMSSSTTPLIAIIGATGTGKSKLAASLSSRFPSEILNADAMQMYHGLPILTNKPSVSERRGVRHHLLDCVPLDAQPWRVDNFVTAAERVIEDLRTRGKPGVVVGGTHYYLQGLLFRDGGVLREEEDGESIEDVEQGISREDLALLEGSAEDMLEKLRTVDPIMAARWHPNDRRKIRRSLEIWMKTGRTASEVYDGQRRGGAPINGEAGQASLLLNGADAAQQKGTMKFPTLIFWLYSDMEALRRRLADRVDDMVRLGLISEIEEMAEYLRRKTEEGATIDQTRGIWVSIGFKEFEPYILAKQSGGVSDPDLEKLRQEGIKRTKIATRQYAKRQIRWIRIKLWKALQRAGAADRLVLLDATDPIKWEEQVAMPAERIAEAFFKGKDLPDPRSLSQTANAVLGSNGAVEETFKCRKCDLCGKSLQTTKQWEEHLTSNGHKRAARSASRRSAEAIEGNMVE
jgi:tRNA dimethylallyltransferase